MVSWKNYPKHFQDIVELFEQLNSMDSFRETSSSCHPPFYCQSTMFSNTPSACPCLVDTQHSKPKIQHTAAHRRSYPLGKFQPQIIKRKEGTYMLTKDQINRLETSLKKAFDRIQDQHLRLVAYRKDCSGNLETLFSLLRKTDVVEEIRGYAEMFCSKFQAELNSSRAQILVLLQENHKLRYLLQQRSKLFTLVPPTKLITAPQHFVSSGSSFPNDLNQHETLYPLKVEVDAPLRPSTNHIAVFPQENEERHQGCLHDTLMTPQLTPATFSCEQIHSTGMIVPEYSETPECPTPGTSQVETGKPFSTLWDKDEEKKQDTSMQVSKKNLENYAKETQQTNPIHVDSDHFKEPPQRNPLYSTMMVHENEAMVETCSNTTQMPKSKPSDPIQTRDNDSPIPSESRKESLTTLPLETKPKETLVYITPMNPIFVPKQPNELEKFYTRRKKKRYGQGQNTLSRSASSPPRVYTMYRCHHDDTLSLTNQMMMCQDDVNESIHFEKENPSFPYTSPSTETTHITTPALPFYDPASMDDASTKKTPGRPSTDFVNVVKQDQDLSSMNTSPQVTSFSRKESRNSSSPFFEQHTCQPDTSSETHREISTFQSEGLKLEILRQKYLKYNTLRQLRKGEYLGPIQNVFPHPVHNHTPSSCHWNKGHTSQENPFIMFMPHVQEAKTSMVSSFSHHQGNTRPSRQCSKELLERVDISHRGRTVVVQPNNVKQDQHNTLDTVKSSSVLDHEKFTYHTLQNDVLISENVKKLPWKRKLDSTFRYQPVRNEEEEEKEEEKLYSTSPLRRPTLMNDSSHLPKSLVHYPRKEQELNKEGMIKWSPTQKNETLLTKPSVNHDNVRTSHKEGWSALTPNMGCIKKCNEQNHSADLSFQKDFQQNPALHSKSINTFPPTFLRNDALSNISPSMIACGESHHFSTIDHTEGFEQKTNSVKAPQDDFVSEVMFLDESPFLPISSCLSHHTANLSVERIRHVIQRNCIRLKSFKSRECIGDRWVAFLLSTFPTPFKHIERPPLKLCRVAS